MPAAPENEPKLARGRAVSVAPTRLGAQAGAEILGQGGNAFDAAVAAGFMEAVVQPGSCGIGGYAATAVGYLAREGKTVALDANTVAPAAATAGMFPTIPGRDPNDYKMPDTRHKWGPLSVGVPGVLGGLMKAHETWGRLPRAKVIAPAIAQARAGVTLIPAHAQRWLAMKKEADGTSSAGRPSGPQTITMPLLADVLEQVVAQGAEGFYQGKIGQAIADFIQQRGGLLTRHDMAAYEAKVVEPVSVSVRGHTLSTPPPASGGLTTLQIVAVMDRLGQQGKTAPWGSAAWFEAMLETLKVVWEERLRHFADGTRMDPPPAFYTTPQHLDELVKLALEGLAHPGPGHLVAPDPLSGTVHFATADADGNLVAWTQTHGGLYGSTLMVPGTEIVLGHGMCRFEPRPGWANSVAPGKRPLHNMCPTLAVREGRVTAAAGASGGRTIVNNTATALMGVLLEGLGPDAALKVPRLQCETLEPAKLEASAGEAVFEALRRRHQVTDKGAGGGTAHVIARDGDDWLAAAEPRLDRATALAAGGSR